MNTTNAALARQELGITQGRLARLANVAACAISSIERGCYRAGPRVRSSVALALGKNESELFDEAGWPIEAARSR